MSTPRIRLTSFLHQSTWASTLLGEARGGRPEAYRGLGGNSHRFGSMRRDGIAVLLICSICLFGPAYAVAQAGSCACATPSWTSEVIGGVSWAHKIWHYLVDSNRAGVVFLDKERLLVYDVMVTEGLSSRQSPEISSPYKLRVSIFDIVSGRKTASLEWRTRAHCSSVHATSAGMLVQTGEILRLYSKDLVMLQEATLPNPDEDEPVVITSSVTGKTIFANRINQRFSRFDVLDGGTLKPVKAWTESPPLRHLSLYSISDTGIAATDFYHERILYTDFGTGKWKVVADNPKSFWVNLPTCDGHHASKELQTAVLYDDEWRTHFSGGIWKETLAWGRDLCRSEWEGDRCLPRKTGKRFLGHGQGFPSHSNARAGLRSDA